MGVPRLRAPPFRSSEGWDPIACSCGGRGSCRGRGSCGGGRPARAFNFRVTQTPSSASSAPQRYHKTVVAFSVNPQAPVAPQTSPEISSTECKPSRRQAEWHPNRAPAEKRSCESCSRLIWCPAGRRGRVSRPGHLWDHPVELKNVWLNPSALLNEKRRPTADRRSQIETRMRKTRKLAERWPAQPTPLPAGTRWRGE